MLRASRSLVVKAILTGILFLAYLSPASAEKKVALVIGNSDYTHVQALKNPSADSRAVGRLFTDLGFEVQLLVDADRENFTRALGDFSQLATGSDVAIFYYAGHGLSLDGRNFLIPVDSNIERASDVKLGAAIDAEVAIDQALSDAKIKLIFLDACRNNPFIEQIKRSLGSTRSVSISNGLTKMDSGVGTLIAFSTAPGQTALDGDGDLSPFADALLKNLSEPGLEIRLAMTKVRADVERSTDSQQTPWESTNLTGFFYFRPPIDEPPITEAPSTNANTSAELDLEYWKSVKDSSDPALLNSYITRFPQGVYKDLAESKLRAIADNSSKLPSRGEVDSQTTPFVQKAAEKPKPLTNKPSSHDQPSKNETVITTRNGTRTETQSPNAPKSAIPIAPAKPKQSSANETGKSGNGGGSDQSKYLEKLTRKNSAVWSVPPGAVIVGPKSGRNFRVLYKGRGYKCRSGGSSSGVQRVICNAQ